MALKLMIPGPVSVEDDVLFQMGQPVRPHYGAEWTADYNETRALLKNVFKQTQASGMQGKEEDLFESKWKIFPAGTKISMEVELAG